MKLILHHTIFRTIKLGLNLRNLNIDQRAERGQKVDAHNENYNEELGAVGVAHRGT